MNFTNSVNFCILALSVTTDLKESKAIYFYLFILPYSFSIHEKANCIAIFWTEGSHWLGSFHFGVWATYLPHKSGASQQVSCPRTQANLLACSPHPPLNAKRPAGKLWIPLFKAFWYDSTRGLNPRSTDCKVDALTTTSLHRLFGSFPNSSFLLCSMGGIVSRNF